MRNILHYKTLAFIALTVWLISSWSGAHSHLCFDGQEPPVTVHMDTLGEHLQHASDEQHVDADVDLNQLLIVKIIKVDLPVLIVAILLLALLFKRHSLLIPFRSLVFYSRVTNLRPPLRAPPVIPA